MKEKVQSRESTRLGGFLDPPMATLRDFLNETFYGGLMTFVMGAL